MEPEHQKHTNYFVKSLPITAAQFFEKWILAVNRKKEELTKFWNKPEKYTKLIFGDSNNDSITNDVGKSLGLSVYNKNYYSIDAIFYRDNIDLTPDTPKNQTWFRNIPIAFEHENYFNKKLFEEVSHLLITNSFLKVLVTYPPKNPEIIMEYLYQIINGTESENNISANGNFLLIFGYKDPFYWKGYLYNSKNWIELN